MPAYEYSTRGPGDMFAWTFDAKKGVTIDFEDDTPVNLTPDQARWLMTALDGWWETANRSTPPR